MMIKLKCHMSVLIITDTLELLETVDTLEKWELIGKRWLMKSNLLYAHCFIFALK